MSAPDPGATYVACLTPPGRAALATLALRGPEAWDIARAVFHPRSATGRALPETPSPGRVWLGRLGTGDEVVLAVKESEPVPWLEIHGHGGPQFTEAANLELLVAFLDQHLK